MANPTIERAALTRLLNTPNLPVLVVNVVIQGQVQVEAIGPGALDRVKVLLLPNEPQNILDYAPSSWWLKSTSLFSAVESGFLDVVTETPVVDNTQIALTRKYIPEPSNPQTGDLLVYNGLGWDRLPAGPAGHVVTSNGPGIVPSYQSVTPEEGDGIDVTTVTLNCISSLAIGDIVYVSSANTVAKTTALGPKPAVGVVQEKPTTTTATVVISGRTLPMFSGLTPGSDYFLSTLGTLTTVKPNVPGSFAQFIGTAQNATTLLVNVDQAVYYTPPPTTYVINGSTVLAVDESTEFSVPVLIGGTTIAPEDYDSIDFVTVAAVTNNTLQGEIALWNLTDSALVVIHYYSGQTTPIEVRTSISLPGGNKLYEVRHMVNGGLTAMDRIVTSWAGFSTKKNVVV